MKSSFALERYFTGPFLIGGAAFLWATDALFRYPAIDSIDPVFIVLVEHVLAVVLLFPWVYSKHRSKILSLNIQEWLAAAFCGIGGSALATVIFTASFRYVNPSVAVLLQKLQPVMVVLIAFLFLGERPARKFYFWGTVALIAGIVLSFPDFKFDFLSEGITLHSKGIHYAFVAALIWAMSTVGGKVLVKRTPPSLATFWRFMFGLLTLVVLIGLAKDSSTMLSWKAFQNPANFFSILYISLIPGLFAMIAYYSGMAKTQASVTTFVELLYPIGAVILNTLFLHTPLDPIQIGAGSVLLLAVTLISF